MQALRRVARWPNHWTDRGKVSSPVDHRLPQCSPDWTLDLPVRAEAAATVAPGAQTMAQSIHPRPFAALIVLAACGHPSSPAPAPGSAPSPSSTGSPTAGSPTAGSPTAGSPTAGSPSAGAPAPVSLDTAAAAITADLLRSQITKLSSDEFEGRGPTTRGDVAARAYLAGQLKAMGYEPAV